MNNKNLQKSKFHIIGFSSEDRNYPVTELLQQSPQSRGWQSQRFCDFPQEMILQLVSPMKVRLIQFMSHQCKISSKVEIYTHMPSQPTIGTKAQYAMNPAEIKFKKIGYFYFNSNEKSNFQSRELKTVYLETPCSYVKLVLNKCHVNKLNVFNQVGLIALSIFGEPLLNNTPDSKVPYQQLEYETKLDKETLEHLRDLERALETAERSEDYGEAKKLNDAIRNLKRVGVQLQKLEERKKIAVANKDYDSAEILLKEIRSLRRAAVPSGLSYQRGRANPGSRQDNREFGTDIHHNNRQPDNYNERRQHSGSSKRDMKEPENDYEEDYRDQAPPTNGNPNFGKMRHSEDVTGNLNKNRGMPIDVNEQVIPAMAGKKNKFEIPEEEEFEMNNDGPGFLNAEEINPKKMDAAAPLLPFLSDDICRGIFSKNWGFREGALNFLRDEIMKGSRSDYLNFSDQSGLFVAVLGAVSCTIMDKISKVGEVSMQLIESLVKNMNPPPLGGSPEFKSYIDKILLSLTLKIGDNKTNVRNLGEDSMYLLADYQDVGPRRISDQMIKSFGVPKAVNDFKHLTARLSMLTRMAEDYGIDDSNVPLNQTIDFAVKQLENQNRDVRQAAHILILTFMKALGSEAISPLLQGVRKNQLDKLYEDYNDQLGMPGDSMVRDEIKKVDAKGRQPQSKPSDYEPTGNIKENSKVCGFCGISDKNFIDAAKYDMHLWKECPVLVTCPQCAMVIEVENFNSHLLNECKYSNKFIQCPRCKEAVPEHEYDEHIENKVCIPAKPKNVANRCGLCHDDIDPGKMGWVRHLIYEGCPNNDRTI